MSIKSLVKLSTVIMTIIVIMVAAILAIVAFPGSIDSLLGNNSLSTSVETRTTGSNASQVIQLDYDLKWQNEPGVPFSCTNCTTAYQFIDIELQVISYQDFRVGTPVRLFAYGTMSESLNYSGLEYVSLAYDNSTPYTNTSTGMHLPYGLHLSVVPNDTITREPMTYAIGSYVKLIAEPVNVTWNSVGGPFYPRLALHYYTGHEFNYKFTGAPVQISDV